MNIQTESCVLYGLCRYLWMFFGKHRLTDNLKNHQVILPASYSAKQKKYWPFLHNCHSHCAKKEVIYREFVIVKSCLIFWCKEYRFPPFCVYFQHFISIAYSREKDLNATWFGPNGWTKANHNKGFISIGQGKKT